MTIVSSGAISINSLVAEYGGSAPHSMSEYYKGGSLVANHSNNANVPTSSTISLSNFYGQSNTSPSNLTCAGTLGSTAPTINKYGATRYGASNTNSPTMASNSPMPFGTITDNTFTNANGSTTFTLDQFWSQTDTLFTNGTSDFIQLVGNYGGQSFQTATGYSNMTVGGVTKQLLVSQLVSNIAVTGNYDASTGMTGWSPTTSNTARWGSSGNFTMSFS